MRRGEERREDTCGEELEDPAVGRGQGEGGPGQGEGGCQEARAGQAAPAGVVEDGVVSQEVQHPGGQGGEPEGGEVVNEVDGVEESAKDLGLAKGE